MNDTPPDDLHTRLLARLRDRLAEPDELPPRLVLTTILRELAKWRSVVIAQEFIKREGTIVQAGPFKGMQYVERTTDGSLVPRLIGCYEGELHPAIEKLIADGIDVIVNIGCAEGYYAVGMARRMPAAAIYAYDTDARACLLCGGLAAANGVAARVTLGGEFSGQDFAQFAGRKTAVLCDIEGGEIALLDPQAYPALRDISIIVECHESEDRKLTAHRAAEIIAQRFRGTHDVKRIDQSLRGADLPVWFSEVSHLDLILATWEWRGTPTPWLVMHPKH